MREERGVRSDERGEMEREDREVFSRVEQENMEKEKEF